MQKTGQFPESILTIKTFCVCKIGLWLLWEIFAVFWQFFQFWPENGSTQVLFLKMWGEKEIWEFLNFSKIMNFHFDLSIVIPDLFNQHNPVQSHLNPFYFFSAPVVLPFSSNFSLKSAEGGTYLRCLIQQVCAFLFLFNLNAPGMFNNSQVMKDSAELKISVSLILYLSYLDHFIWCSL